MFPRYWHKQQYKITQVISTFNLICIDAQCNQAGRQKNRFWRHISLFERSGKLAHWMMKNTAEGTVRPWALLSLLPVHRYISTARCFHDCRFIAPCALWLPPFHRLSDIYIKGTPLDAKCIVRGFVLSFQHRTKLKFLPLHNFTAKTITWISHLTSTVTCRIHQISEDMPQENSSPPSLQ